MDGIVLGSRDTLSVDYHQWYRFRLPWHIVSGLSWMLLT